MMKSRAPPDKVGVLHHLLPMEFHGFTTELSLSSVKLIPRSHYRAITTIAIIVSDRDIQAKTKI